MTKSAFEGRWVESAKNFTRQSELLWVEPGKGGLQTHVATINGRQVAAIRKHLYERGFSVSVPGWVWTKPMANSVAAKIGVKESNLKGFSILRDAKMAVQYAFSHLPAPTSELDEDFAEDR